MTQADAQPLAPALERMEHLARASLESERADAIVALARDFHRHTAPEDFEGRRDEDLLGALLDLQRLLERPAQGLASVRVVNPTLEVDGWTTPHSVVQIHHRDMRSWWTPS